jgi:predicted nuclease of predicted toxin-antitoxin system
MKIKLDENIPIGLLETLCKLGHEVDSVLSEGLQGSNDDCVWSATQEAGRFLITQDLDFSDLRKFVFGSHCGILVVRLREPGRLALINRVLQVFDAEDVETLTGCFVVVTDHKIRVRRPSL